MVSGEGKGEGRARVRVRVRGRVRVRVTVRVRAGARVRVGVRVPACGRTVKGSSLPSVSIVQPTCSSTAPAFLSSKVCERAWNIIVGRKASVLVSHSSTPYSHWLG